jgi:DNA-binding CsgD family transcriptional regulator
VIIAAKLVVTTKTVEGHLGRVDRKLDVSGRDELDRDSFDVP